MAAVQCKAVEGYAAYIDKYADYLKEKCSKLSDCIDKLVGEENQLTIIRGENISLNKTCGLVYRTNNDTYTTLTGKCEATEREEIREDLENNLQNQLDYNKKWRVINTCLGNVYGYTERTNRVEEICQRAKIRKEICNSTQSHRLVEAFFNDEIRNLQCKCKQIAKSEGNAAYIDKYADILKEKCSKLTGCIDKLVTEENQLTIITGDNISLNKTCGLVYRTNNDTYTTLTGKCEATEREEIREDLENNLQNQLDNNKTWKGINTCLGNLYGYTERTNRVEEICLRAKIRKEICNSTQSHRLVEAFFNDEILNLQSKCKQIAKSDQHQVQGESKLPVIIGIGVGSFLLLLLILCLGIWWYRRRKQKSKKSYTGYRQSLHTPGLPGAQDDGDCLEPAVTGMMYRPMPPFPQQMSSPGYEDQPHYSEADKNYGENVYVNTVADSAKGIAHSTPQENAPVPSNVLVSPVESHYDQLEDRAQNESENNYTKLLV
ncbi:uncharacterized protein LOC106080055 [Biomphalaria glabrata]|uniref:Uncharacterized protein LOC106080055 n=1 Tax=Biomphalaria glabrata TaxID=6526 RepID=A0A9W2ZJ27_BIOGL|nr:uncharacterized protein LOC106080055 [Biomphalaria glabrata]